MVQCALQRSPRYPNSRIRRNHTTSLGSMGLLDLILFLVYPLFQVCLFALERIRYRKDPAKKVLFRASLGNTSFLGAMFLFGSFASGVMEPIRIVEIVLVWISPIPASFLLTASKTNRKKRIVLLSIIIIIVLLNTYRLTRALQRSEISWESPTG